VVVEGSGSGNLPAACVPGLRQLVDRGIPVVLTSRCGAGPVTPLYGGPGGGATLVELGVIPGSDLSGPKARIALMFLLGMGADLGGVRDWFRRAG
jgi:L-asparaginase